MATLPEHVAITIYRLLRRIKWAEDVARIGGEEKRIQGFGVET
jgi:hypothetical protein